MNKTAGWAAIAALIVLSVLSSMCAAEETDRIWFGLGGPSTGLLLPDVGFVNEYLVDQGFAELPEVMFFSGGRGRGGSLHGLSVGGIGWAGSTSSRIGDLVAEFDVGFGGIEFGYVVGGDEGSLLTLGAVLGGGGSMLTLRDGIDPNAACQAILPGGIAPQPVSMSRGSAFLGIEPFVGFQIQLLPFVGFEVHLGYLVPLVDLEWGDLALPDDSLCLEGPAVGISLTWGAIGRLKLERLAETETVDLQESLDGPCVLVEGTMGEIRIEQDLSLGTALQTPSYPRVEVCATKHAMWGVSLDEVEVLCEPTRCGLWIHAVGPDRGHWSVDYAIRVPVGTELEVRHGSGSVELVGLRASADVDLGIGFVGVIGFEGESLRVENGVGHVLLGNVSSKRIDVEMGVGEVDVSLMPSASYELDASVGIGEISLPGTEGMADPWQSGFDRRVEVTLGEGGGEAVIDVGIGEIRIDWPQQ